MKSFIHFIICATILINFTNVATAITEEEESECIDNVFSKKQLKEVDKLQMRVATVTRDFPNIFRDNRINLPSYKRKCKRLGNSLMTFLTKVRRDIEPCFREITLREFQAFEALSRDLIQFVCNFKENEIRALINEQTKHCFLSTFDKVSECIKTSAGADEEGNYSFFENFCDFDSSKMLQCSRKSFTKCDLNNESEGPVLIIESLLHFMNKKHKCHLDHHDGLS